MTKPDTRPRTPDTGPREAIVLASASPRRREILTQAGVKFVAIPPQIDETMRLDESPTALARRLAVEKAEAVAADLAPEDERLVLGADTIVVIGDEVLGKPRDAEHAVRMLSRLVGHRHCVITGVAVARRGGHATSSLAVETQVSMRDADEDELRDYVASGEPLDKAGAYAIQGEAGERFVTSLEGSRSNVVGLPLEETLALLDAAAGGGTQ